MENLIYVSNIAIIFLIFSFPFFLYYYLIIKKVRHLPITFFIYGILILGLLMLFLGWWDDKSDMILLNYYGFDVLGASETESYKNVLPENISKVKGIETSTMGLGWPIKSLFMFVIYTPYLALSFFLSRIINKYITKRA